MEVYALVGPSGSGKSHRALIVGHKYRIDTIIDDGLLINQNQIVAGRSAKRSPTRIGAVKRAIFMNPGHAEEIREAISEQDPDRLLILGTSEKMVERIRKALQLPPLQEVIHIREIASEKEIETAQKVRAEEGKHVIPVPTIEVRREFPGSLVDSIEVFLLRRIGKSSRSPQKLGEKSVVRPSFSLLGKLVISDEAVVQLLKNELKDMSCISEINRTDIQTNEEGIMIGLDLDFHFGCRIHKEAREIQKSLGRRLEYLTGLDVLKVDIYIKDLLLPEDMQIAEAQAQLP